MHFRKGFIIKTLIFLTVFSPGSSPAQTVTLGNGSGNIYYDGKGVKLSIIKIRAGEYTGVTIANVTGQDSLHPVLIINDSGQVASTAGSDAGFELSNCRYIHFTGTGDPGTTYGFKSTGGSTGSFDAHYGSSDIEIDHLECGGSGYAGIVFRTYPSDGCQWSISGGWAIHNMIIHDNFVHDVGGEGMYLGQSHYGDIAANGYDPVNNPLVQQGHSCAGGNESPVIGAHIYRNIVRNVGFDGIQLSGCIANCSITDNTIVGFATSNVDGQDGGITWNPGCVGKIEHNYIEYVGHGVCMGIMYQGQGDTYITNNTLVGGGNGQVGLALLRNTSANIKGSNHHNIYISKNIITGFTTGYWWFGANGFGSNTFFTENKVQAQNLYYVGNGDISTLQKKTNLEIGGSWISGLMTKLGHRKKWIAAASAFFALLLLVIFIRSRRKKNHKSGILVAI